MPGPDEEWDGPTNHERRAPSEGSDVIRLDRVRVKPDEVEPITVPVERARIAVVAAGDDSARVRRLCHAAGLYVPVLSNIAIVDNSLAIVVVGEPSPPAPDRVVHVVRPTIGDDHLRDLLIALTTGRAIDVALRPGASPAKVIARSRALDTLRSIARVEATCIDAITELTGADRAYCLAYDSADGSLWSEALRRRMGDERRAFAGIAGWAARTGLPAHASCAGDDPRWLPEIDDPEGKPQTRIAAQPIVHDRRVRAVLVAVRRWRRSDFSDGELEALARFAELASAPVERVTLAPSPTPPPLPAVDPPDDTTTIDRAPVRASASTTLTGLPAQRRPATPPPLPDPHVRAAEAAVAAARDAKLKAEEALAEAERTLEELKKPR
jgi:hypothetical protein